MSGQIPVTRDFAQRVLAQAIALCKIEEYDAENVQNLRRQLLARGMQFEADQTGYLILHDNQATPSGDVIERSLIHACRVALDDFYFESTHRLLDARLRFVNCPLSVVHQQTSVPRLYQLIIRRIAQSGFRAEIADLELALDGTGLQFIALQLAGENWPVLVIGEDRAPVVGGSREGDMTVSPEVLLRMKEEARRIGRASNAAIEESDPVVAIAGVMSELAKLLPSRVNNAIPPASGGTGAAGANQGGSGLERGSGDQGLSFMATSIAGSYSPNFCVDTSSEKNCSVASSHVIVANFSHFGGPKTPAHAYLTGGYYYFEVTAPDGRTYLTPHKVKVPDRNPLILNFP